MTSLFVSLVNTPTGPSSGVLTLEFASVTGVCSSSFRETARPWFDLGNTAREHCDAGPSVGGPGSLHALLPPFSFGAPLSSRARNAAWPALVSGL